MRFSVFSPEHATASKNPISRIHPDSRQNENGNEKEKENAKNEWEEITTCQTRRICEGGATADPPSDPGTATKDTSSIFQPRHLSPP